ncbi:hypothetical protein [Photobacterium sp. GB-72]|uniref:hypothetical protein n=1 Tax=Photobacterium sp. GB-72 TaxID=2022105 RepID=UPI000D1761D7|nr:hypothetical protein [Photobacterium sp. GB-72]PSV27667.1 hypothetical protein C9J40_20235 [Photobacterium sp. GB-72]
MDYDIGLNNPTTQVTKVNRLESLQFTNKKQQAFIELYLSLKINNADQVVEKDDVIFEMMRDIFTEVYSESSIYVTVCQYLLDSIEQGISRDDAMSQYFNNDVVQIFAITTTVTSQASGSNVLSLLSQFLKRQFKINATTKRTLFISAFIIAIGILTFVITATTALPLLASSYSIELTGYSKLIANIGNVITTIGFFWLPILIVLIKLFSYSLSHFAWLPIYRYQKVAHLFSMLALIKSTGETTIDGLELIKPNLIPFLHPHVEQMLNTDGSQKGFDHLDTGLLSLEARVKLRSIGRIQSVDADSSFLDLSEFIETNNTKKIETLAGLTPLFALGITIVLMLSVLASVVMLMMEGMGLS